MDGDTEITSVASQCNLKDWEFLIRVDIGVIGGEATVYHSSTGQISNVLQVGRPAPNHHKSFSFTVEEA